MKTSLSAEISSWLHVALRWCLSMVAAALVVCCVTGIALQMYYVPSSATARDERGRPLSVVSAEYTPIVNDTGDTLALPGQRALVAQPGGKAVSVAAASVQVDIEHATGGSLIRYLHGASTVVLLIAAAGAVVAGALACTWKHGFLWPSLCAIPVIAIVAAWTGRLLPDDAYAEASRTVVGNAIRLDMVGASIVRSLTGLTMPIDNTLPRILSVHAWLTTIPLVALIGVVIKRWRWPSAAELAIVVAALCCLCWLVYPLTLADQTGSNPWWPFLPAHVLAAVLGGADAASYLLMALFIAVCTLPWWHSRVSPRVPIAVLAGTALLFLFTFLW